MGKMKHGFASFGTIWLGQLASLVGSGLTAFGLSVWVYQQTGSVTELALVNLFFHLGIILLSPLAGPLVDRWDRRWTMILSDTASAIFSLVIALLFLMNLLEIWHIYAAVFLGAASRAFQVPAYTATIAILVPKKELGRANGMTQLGRGVGDIAAPAIAGALMAPIGLGGIILIDFITYLVALITLLFTNIPRTEPTLVEEGSGSLWREAVYGWRYIQTRRGLMTMLLFVTVASLISNMALLLLTPLVLTIASPATLGTMLSVGSVGILIGGLLMSIWGGPKRRIYGVIGPGLLMGAGLLLIGVQTNLVLMTTAMFVSLIGLPMLLGSVDVIWQTKVAPVVQGRVFAARNVVMGIAPLLAAISTGPVADNIFEPLLAEGGLLSANVGQFIGVGPGRGIGFLFVVLGIFMVLAVLLAWFYPSLRFVEDELPDMIGENPVGSIEGDEKHSSTPDKFQTGLDNIIEETAVATASRSDR